MRRRKNLFLSFLSRFLNIIVFCPFLLNIRVGKNNYKKFPYCNFWYFCCNRIIFCHNLFSLLWSMSRQGLVQHARPGADRGEEEWPGAAPDERSSRSQTVRSTKYVTGTRHSALLKNLVYFYTPELWSLVWMHSDILPQSCW